MSYEFECEHHSGIKHHAARWGSERCGMYDKTRADAGSAGDGRGAAATDERRASPLLLRGTDGEIGGQATLARGMSELRLTGGGGGPEGADGRSGVDAGRRHRHRHRRLAPGDARVTVSEAPALVGAPEAEQGVLRGKKADKANKTRLIIYLCHIVLSTM